MASLKERDDLEFPDVRFFIIVKNSKGETLTRQIRPLLGTRTLDPADFTLLGPGSSTGTIFDLTRWPMEYSFTESGTYTIKAVLRFVEPEWLQKQKQSRSWLVPPSTLEWLLKSDVPLYGGLAETNEVKIQICVPTKAKPCKQ